MKGAERDDLVMELDRLQEIKKSPAWSEIEKHARAFVKRKIHEALWTGEGPPHRLQLLEEARGALAFLSTLDRDIDWLSQALDETERGHSSNAPQRIPTIPRPYDYRGERP